MSRFAKQVAAWAAILAGSMAASTFACGPPPDGWPGAGRSFTPPPVSMPGGEDSGADTEAPPPPKDSGTTPAKD